MKAALQQTSLKQVPLCHMKYSRKIGWRESKPTASPRVEVTMKIHQSSYRSLSISQPHCILQPPSPIQAVPDSGAQMCVVPARTIRGQGIDPSSLFKVKSRVCGASDGSKINILGGALMEISGTGSKSHVKTLELVYVANNVSQTYLSLDVCLRLGILHPNFPEIGSAKPEAVVASYSVQGEPSTGLPPCSNSGTLQPGDPPCSCPRRSLPPEDKPVLPCEPSTQNVPKLKQYILERYASSAFNCCERQKLPLMKGSPPVQLHVDPKAKPVAVHTPIQIPLHWQEAVKDGLDRDVRLGVLEKVPLNTPTVWQSRMVCMPKHNGEPRRTIDFQKVNEHCPRQTHHTRSPWLIAAWITSTDTTQ